MVPFVSDNYDFLSQKCVWVNGPIIVGAGPSGLAVADSLKEHGVPYVILERSDRIASLWKKRAYDRLKLHLPKQFCQLPGLPFPDSYPKYPCKKQFIDYLESSAKHFHIEPRFNQTVQSARYEETSGLWRVKTIVETTKSEAEYIGHWLLVATRENAERVVLKIEGLKEFGRGITHVCDYTSGEAYIGKKVDGDMTSASLKRRYYYVYRR